MGEERRRVDPIKYEETRFGNSHALGLRHLLLSSGPFLSLLVLSAVFTYLDLFVM